MAITGLLLSFFMVFHLFGNLFLFVSEQAFNSYVEKLNYFKPLVRVAEFFCFLFLAMLTPEFLCGGATERQNKKADHTAKQTPLRPPARLQSQEVLFLFF